MKKCGPWGKVGFSKAMSAGWIKIDKSQVYSYVYTICEGHFEFEYYTLIFFKVTCSLSDKCFVIK